MRGRWGWEKWFQLHYTYTLLQSLTNDVLGGEQGLKLSDTMEHLGHTAVCQGLLSCLLEQIRPAKYVFATKVMLAIPTAHLAEQATYVHMD